MEKSVLELTGEFDLNLGDLSHLVKGLYSMAEMTKDGDNIQERIGDCLYFCRLANERIARLSEIAYQIQEAGKKTA